MSNDEVNVATAALSIAIAAMVVACGQLLQQLFSAADGFRRCQASVIGEWARLIELPFRWSSFRFEVRFTTPHFSIPGPNSGVFHTSCLRDPGKSLPGFPISLFVRMRALLQSPNTFVALVGDKVSRRGTFCIQDRQESEEKASWTLLLDDIHDLQQLKGLCKLPLSDLVCITRKTRSWDLMPPDIVRPVASTTLGDLVTIAHRMGMEWSRFDPEEGKLRASGDGCSLSTSFVQGMGLVVEYTRDSTRSKHDGYRISSREADLLSRGALHDSHDTTNKWRYIFLRKKSIPFVQGLVSGFPFLRDCHDEYGIINKSITNRDIDRRLPGIADLTGLISPWLRDAAMDNAFIVENPFPVEVICMGELAEAVIVWRAFLRRKAEHSSDACKAIVIILDHWMLKLRSMFYTYHQTKYWRSPRGQALVGYQEIFDFAQAFLVNSKVPIQSLVAAHIKVNCRSVEQAAHQLEKRQITYTGLDKRDAIENELIHMPTDFPWDPFRAERALVYAQNVGKVVDETEARWGSQLDRSSIEDTWWMLMLRMQAWHLSAKLVTREGIIVSDGDYYPFRRVYIL